MERKCFKCLCITKQAHRKEKKKLGLNQNRLAFKKSCQILTELIIFYCFYLPVLICFVKVLVAQLCLTLCDPMDYSPPDSLSLSMEFSRQEYWSG